jgi:hypothetical protein
MPYFLFSNRSQRLLILSLVLAATALFATAADAACTGSSPNLTAPTFDDITSCHTIAINGDTITVTPGSYTEASTISISKYVKVIGTGVTVTDSSCPSVCSGPNLITINESTAGSIYITGFTFMQGTARHQAPAAVIQVNPATGGKPVVIQNNNFGTNVNNGWTGNNLISMLSYHGVIAGNTVWGYPSTGLCQAFLGFIHSKMTSGSVPSFAQWEAAAYYGSADTNGDRNLYLENNHLNYVTLIDADDLTRVVIRHNDMFDSDIGAHGADTSNPGMRYAEIYSNTWTYDTSPLPSCGGGFYNATDWIFLRGGTARIWDNTIPNIPPNAIHFADWKLRRNAGDYACWDVIVNPGSGWPSPRAVGWGYSTGATAFNISGSSASGTTVRQDLESVYIWHNTGTGNYGQPNSDPQIDNYSPADAACGAMPDSAATYIVKNREFYTQNASIDTTQGVSVGVSGSRPGTCRQGVAYFNTDLNRLDVCTATNTWGNSYTPYTYPHPLVAGSSAGPTVSISITQ